LEIPVNYFVFGNVFRNDPSCAFGGKIDDIGIWNRALNDSEIFQLFNNYYTAYSRPNVRTDSRIKLIVQDSSSILNTSMAVRPQSVNLANAAVKTRTDNLTTSQAPNSDMQFLSYSNLNNNTSNDYFNPETDVYIEPSTFTLSATPKYENNYTSFGRYKNTGLRNSAFFRREIVNGVVSFLNSLGYNELVKLGNTSYDAGTGFEGYYTEVEFKQINGYIKKKLITYLFSLGNDKNNYPYASTYFNSEEITYGIIDINGKIIIKPDYDFVAKLSEGLFRVVKKNESGEWMSGFMNESGKLVLPLIYRTNHVFSEGLCAVDNSNERTGYIDKFGKVVIPFQYYMAEDFKNGIAEVRKPGTDNWTKINKKGVQITTNTTKNKTNTNINDDDLINAIVAEYQKQALSTSVNSKRSSGNLDIDIGRNKSSNTQSQSNYGSSVCPRCEPYNSKGHRIQDFNVSTRLYSNERYIKKPGYIICKSCYGTGLMSQTGPKICNQCNGERFLKCSYCNGTGKKN